MASRPAHAVVIEVLSLLGLFAARRFLLPSLRFNDGTNDAVGGTVQAIGVFYGITVGLIAASVWATNSTSADLVSKEAASIGALYADVSGYPSPVKEELQAKLRDYTVFTIEQAWPAQKKGQILDGGTRILDDFRTRLSSFQSRTTGEAALHQETLHAFNNLTENRRLRVGAVLSGLSGVMWAVIWIGAAFSISVAYFYKIEDPRIHAILVALMSGFLSVVLFMIVHNDRPFYGYDSITADSFKLILDRLIAISK
ncbi:MAG TPA: hypothetical protein VGN90_03850 [Pyrinomonadaceae bacterium]|nr:hypothetical protein [Pyrinomonadaceae bacterium]